MSLKNHIQIYFWWIPIFGFGAIVENTWTCQDLRDLVGSLSLPLGINQFFFMIFITKSYNIVHEIYWENYLIIMRNSQFNVPAPHKFPFFMYGTPLDIMSDICCSPSGNFASLATFLLVIILIPSSFPTYFIE